MKIVFIENRYATLIYEQAAIALQRCGHEIHWIVQNHVFSPKLPNVHKLPYPINKDLLDFPPDTALNKILISDRGIRYFGIKSTHYLHYRKHINNILNKIIPDVVFGETTQFHELIAINLCKDRDIPYLSPNASRYPPNRILFFLNDTFDPVGGCGISMESDKRSYFLDNVIHRRLIPSYMEPKDSAWKSRLQRVCRHLQIFIGWALGERYVTPSPLRKLQLGYQHKIISNKWDSLADSRWHGGSFKNSSRWVLYPLQMQPESNLDVFGQPWIDQHEIIGRAAEALSKVNGFLIVKPNPKSKYEMSKRLLETVEKFENIIPLRHDFPMREIFMSAPLVLSVTGTVIIECIFNSKPVAVLGSHNMRDLIGVTPVDSPEQVVNVMLSLEGGDLNCASREDALKLIGEVYSKSYDALLFDPVTRPDLFHKENVVKIQEAFMDVIKVFQT
jgi:hypothetical protein